MYTRDLDGKTAYIREFNTSVGLLTAYSLAQEGCNLILHSSSINDKDTLDRYYNFYRQGYDIEVEIHNTKKELIHTTYSHKNLINCFINNYTTLLEGNGLDKNPFINFYKDNPFLYCVLNNKSVILNLFPVTKVDNLLLNKIRHYTLLTSKLLPDNLEISFNSLILKIANNLEVPQYEYKEVLKYFFKGLDTGRVILLNNIPLLSEPHI